MWEHVEEMVKQANSWAGWPTVRSLRVLELSRSAYYRRRRVVAHAPPVAGCAARPRSPHALLSGEREAVLKYAKDHPTPRHRELAWKMVDDNVAFVSPSAVYRILHEEGLVPTWPPKRQKRHKEEEEKAKSPDERWQSDIRYVQVNGRKYYLVNFIDEFSRVITHHELMFHLDGDTLSLEAQRALEKLPPGVRPRIQTDNGSGYVSQEFKKVLTEFGVGHVKITPHCPEENGLVERANRTIGEALEEVELRDYEHAREVIGGIIDWYNNERLHSALHFLRPVDYYRGNPEQLLEQRRKKMAEARHRRREQNLEVRQTTMSFEATALESSTR